MFKKLQKTLIMLLAVLISGMVPTISAIAAVELVGTSPEFEAVPNKTIEVFPGDQVDFKINLAYSGGNRNNTSGSITVDTDYYLGYSSPPNPTKKLVKYSGETLSASVDNGHIFVGTNVKPGTYIVPINVTISDDKPSTGNSLVNGTNDNLIVRVLPENVKPVVKISNPVQGGFYQSSQLPANPVYTVTDQSTYTSSISGWSTAQGQQTVTVTAIDEYGNVGSSSVTYTVDNTAPVITSDIVNGGVYNSNSLKDKVTSYYTITEPNLQSSSTPDLDLTVGSHTVKITALDKAGNSSEMVINYIIDNEAPTISFKFANGGFYTSTKFNTFNPYYLVEDENLDQSKTNASTASKTEGYQSITVSAADKANNQNSATAGYTIDDTPPTVTINLEDGKYYNASSLSKVGQFYTATDVNILNVQAAGFGSTDGHYKAAVSAVDKADNFTSKTVEYYVDTIDPVITIDATKIANGGLYKSSYLQSLTNFYTVEDVNKDEVEASPFDVTPGSHALTIKATDKAGNSKTETISYIVDDSAPAISFNLTPEGIYNSANLPANYYTTSDNNEVVSVVKDAYNKDEGTHELTVTAMDAAGNTKTATIKYTVDDTAPNVAISLPTNGGVYKSSALPEKPTFSVNELHSYTTQITGFNKGDDGEHEVSVQATDAAGNKGSASVTYTVDNTKPVITSKIIDGGYYNKETLEKIGEYYEVSDANIVHNDITASELILTEGRHKAVISAIDKAGNESVKTIEYTVDNEVPTITFKFEDSGFYTSENFKKFDPYYLVVDENLDESTIKANEVSFAEKENLLTVSASDLAKNANSATAQYTIDDTNPEVTINLVEGKYYNQNEIDSVSDFYSATDKNMFSVNPSGFGKTDGNYHAAVIATDKAGNVTTKSVTYHVDTVDPEITIDASKLANGEFYKASYLENLQDYYTVKDENIDRIDVSPFEKENGTYTFTITATDKAGNSASTSLSYTVDNIAPTISFAIDKEYYKSANLPLEYYTANDENGVVKVESPELDKSEGPHTLTVTAWDTAGNKTSESITYTVDNTAPKVAISLPKEDGFYQTSALPEDPAFTVDEKNPYTTQVLGYNRETETTSTVTVNATDAAGNIGTDSATYTVDNTAPTITSSLIDGEYYNAEALENLGMYYDVSDINLVEDSAKASELDTSEGNHSATITAVDKAGNKAEQTIHYIVDNTVPAISFVFNDEGFYTANTFKTYDPYYQIIDTNLDDSTIKASEFKVTEKRHEVTVSASDKAKNFNSASASYTIDNTEPEVSISLEAGKYYTLAALAELGPYYSATDTNLAKVDASELGTIDGTYTATVTATDKAGNLTTKSVTYHVDNTAPEIEIDATKLTDGGFYNADYLKGISGDLYTVTDHNPKTDSASALIFEEGNHNYTVTATDKAGNTTRKTISYTVDNTAPTVTFTLTPEGYYQTAKLPGTYYNAADNNEGLIVNADTFVKTEGIHTLVVTATDKAGNSITNSIKYTVDNTAPVVSIEKPQQGQYYQSADLPAEKPVYKITDTNPYDFNIVGYNKEDESEHTVSIIATDVAGNVGTASVTYTVDNTKPTITSALSEGGIYNADTLRALSQYYSAQDTNLDPESIHASNLILTEGSHTATINAADRAGNEANLTIHYTVDNTKPAISFNFDDNGFFTSEKFKMFDPYYFIVDENLDDDSVDFKGLSFTEDKHELSVNAADKAGNSNSAKASYTIDNTAPEVSLSIEAGKYYNLAALEKLGQYWTATDTNLFDVQHTALATTDGTYTATVTATDNAGNVTTKSVEYHLDNTAPVIQMEEAKLKDGGFYNASYLKDLTEKPYSVTENNPATDSASAFKFDEGTYEYTVTATDKAGNTSPKTISYTVDNTNPTISLKIKENGIYTSAVLNEIGQYYSTSDNNNDVTVEDDSLITDKDGTYTLKVIATDKAGNISTASVTYTVDDTKPVVSFFLTNGQHYTTQALSEALSGPRTYYAVTDEHLADIQADPLQTDEGVHKLTVTANDTAGNQQASSITYTVDNTAPVISGLQGLKDGQRFLVGQDVTVIPLATDKLDPNHSLQFAQKLDTTKAGIHTVSVTASDQAGNKSIFKYSYHVYDFSGVKEPINADGTSTFKKNSTIPVKFDISDGKDLVKDAIATLQIVKVTNYITSTPVDAISTSAASEGNLFRSSDGQYIFNLGTKTLDEGQYKALITILLDGKKIIKESSTFYIRK
ncbi:hypothetical protein CN481_04270 [Bacillus sp. AFS006103]|nr:hypothetical protein CN481_04270 [Bacillus sp. AFS006103]